MAGRGGPPPIVSRGPRCRPRTRSSLAFVRAHNLWISVLETGETIQFSRDGERFYDYATPLPRRR